MRQEYSVGGALHLYSGMTLGRYELVLRVAAGGMGEVWAARLRREHGFQKLFAVKVLRPELSGDPGFRRMFLEEAEVAARIRHPNVVPVVDLGEEGGRLFLVMEWVCGEPLAAAIRGAHGRPAPPLVAARIAYQICAGLDAAHELCDDEGRPLGLVHCDVSPENLLITSEGLVRLVDFGVAVCEGMPCVGPARSTPPPLSQGTRGAQGAQGTQETRGAPHGSDRPPELRGKAPYMAPEHILGAPSDRRADLFAVGILLYELLSGSHPFLADDDEITMTRIASESPAAPLSSRSRPTLLRISAPPPAPVPAALEGLVSVALAKAPGERPATAAAMMRALEEAMPDVALQSTDGLVALWLQEVLGDALQLRATKLREALEALEQGIFVPPQASLCDEAPIEEAPIEEGSEEALPSFGRRGREALARGARMSAAAMLATVACTLLGSAATGDSSLAAIDTDRDPPSSRASGPARLFRGSSLAAGLRPAAHEDAPERPPFAALARASGSIAAVVAPAVGLPTRRIAQPAKRGATPSAPRPARRGEYKPRGI